MKQLGIVAVAVVMLFSATGMAQAQAKQGDREVLAFAMINSIFGGDAGSNTTGLVNLSFGQYLRDNLEVGGGPQFTISHSGGTQGVSGSTNVNIGVSGFGRYYFAPIANGKAYPYAGGELQLFSINPPEGQTFGDNVFFAGIAGIKDYLTPRASLDVKASLGFGTFRMFSLSAGLTVLF